MQNKKTLIAILGFLLLLISIPVGVYLVKQQQTFKSKAAQAPTTSFSLKADPQTAQAGQKIVVSVLANSDIHPSNLFVAKLSFPADKVEVESIKPLTFDEGFSQARYLAKYDANCDDKIDTTDQSLFDSGRKGGFVKSWLQQAHNNQTGKISLIGAVPTPGFKTDNPEQAALMVCIVFKTKVSGEAALSFDASSAIYKDIDNTNILVAKNSLVVTIFAIDEHFGVAGGVHLTNEQLEAVGSHWGATWSTLFPPSPSSTYHYVPMFRLGRQYWANSQGWDPTKCSISACPQITELVQSTLTHGTGQYYQLGNEPQGVSGQDGGVTMAEHVTQYEILAHEIKRQDSTAKIIGPAIFAWMQRDNWGKKWLTQFVQAYKASHNGQVPPMDVLNIHLYDNTNVGPHYAYFGTNTQLLINDLEDFRIWANQNGYQDKPIWITEFGIIHCNENELFKVIGGEPDCISPNDVRLKTLGINLVYTMLNYFHTNQDRLKLDKWFIFMYRNETQNSCGDRGCNIYPIFLYDESNNITDYGRLYRRLSNQFAAE